MEHNKCNPIAAGTRRPSYLGQRRQWLKKSLGDWIKAVLNWDRRGRGNLGCGGPRRTGSAGSLDCGREQEVLTARFAARNEWAPAEGVLASHRSWGCGSWEVVDIGRRGGSRAVLLWTAGPGVHVDMIPKYKMSKRTKTITTYFN
jgi:hypothetical protein